MRRQQVVGSCWACGGPVRAYDVERVADPSVLDRTGRPIKRLAHRTLGCADRVRAKVRTIRVEQGGGEAIEQPTLWEG